MASPSSIFRQIRPSGVRQIRLCSGLVLLLYVSLHLTNHALGNVSLAAMERGLLVQKFIWQGWIGTIALYTALTVHFVLGLYALYERRRLHWTPPELAQLLLGLAVPPLLANHLAVTRVAFAEFGLNKGYAQELYSFWIAAPALGWIQLTLLVVAWLHGCLGIAFWLRLKPWFEKLQRAAAGDRSAAASARIARLPAGGTDSGGAGAGPGLACRRHRAVASRHAATRSLAHQPAQRLPAVRWHRAAAGRYWAASRVAPSSATAAASA